MKTSIYYLTFVVILATFIMQFSPNSEQATSMLAEAGKQKGTDILFLKGKFILKDKKGSIVISDDKKPCHCGHYYR